MKILPVSDLHFKKSHGQEELLDRARREFERLKPDIILITGDLTNNGHRKEYKAVGKLIETLDFCDKVLIIRRRTLYQSLSLLVY